MTRPVRHYVTACRGWQLEPLYQSMVRHCQPFVLHVLAWDWAPPVDIIAEGRRLTFETREAFLARHPGLLPLPGEPRGTTDTVCSVRWTFLVDVMRLTGQPATAIDGDLLFWSDPSPALEPHEASGAPLLVTEHGFPLAEDGLPGVSVQTHARYGRFNAGIALFRDVAAAEMMAALCREWCRTEVRTVGGRPWFGDQGALEQVARLLGAEFIAHPGVNVAPWNVHWRAPFLRVGVADPPGEGERPALIAYHYSSLRFDGQRVTQLANPEYEITHEQIHRFYDPYVKELEAVHAAAR